MLDVRESTYLGQKVVATRCQSFMSIALNSIRYSNMTKKKNKSELKRLTWRGLCPTNPPPLLEAEDVTKNEKRREGRICCEWREGGFGGGGGFLVLVAER